MRGLAGILLCTGVFVSATIVLPTPTCRQSEERAPVIEEAGEIYFREGDSRGEPIYVDLDGDSVKEGILTVSCEKVRHGEGDLRNACKADYSITATVTRRGSNAEEIIAQGGPWCSKIPLRRVFFSGGKVWIYAEHLRSVP